MKLENYINREKRDYYGDDNTADAYVLSFLIL